MKAPIIEVAASHRTLIQAYLGVINAAEEAKRQLGQLIQGIVEQGGGSGVPYKLSADGARLEPNTYTVEQVDALLSAKAPAEHPHELHLHENGHVHQEG